MNIGLQRASAIAGIIAAGATVIMLGLAFYPQSVPEPQTGLRPTLEPYSTGWIEGEGKSTPDYCDPRRDAYAKQHPDWEVEVTYLPEQHEENRNWLGIKRDRYMYSCSFAVTAR
jgi:hypothetical protein